MAVERYVDTSSVQYSSSSEFRRDPGIDLAGGFCRELLPLTMPEGEASWELDCENRLFRPGGEVMLLVEKRFGLEREDGKPASEKSGGVVGSLTGPPVKLIRPNSIPTCSISELSVPC